MLDIYCEGRRCFPTSRGLILILRVGVITAHGLTVRTYLDTAAPHGILLRVNKMGEPN